MSADIGNIRVGQAPMGVPPQQKTPAEAPRQAPTISVPAATAPSGMLKKVVVGILGAIVIGGIALLITSLFGGDETPTPSQTPTPAAATSAPVLGRSLSSYFKGQTVTATLKNDTVARTDFASALANTAPKSKQAVPVIVELNGGSATAAQFLDIMLDGGVPADLASTLASDWMVLAFGQTEQFTASGTVDPDAAVGTRIAIVMELSNATKANQALTVWENTGLASAGAPFFGYGMSRRVVQEFSTGTYRQIAVRYWNFPYADRSIDYAIVLASNGKNYLVLTGSREAMFFAIDQLMQ
ncbi:MAG: hypothetical protein IT406_01705 [Candidatus Yanofskybacteria bacterium]|nr:hypothetical protein [Candidatus Yanofskybacteria bacterium]